VGASGKKRRGGQRSARLCGLRRGERWSRPRGVAGPHGLMAHVGDWPRKKKRGGKEKWAGGGETGRVEKERERVWGECLERFSYFFQTFFKTFSNFIFFSKFKHYKPFQNFQTNFKTFKTSHKQHKPCSSKYDAQALVLLKLFKSDI
jgi:hypothetical protein